MVRFKALILIIFTLILFGCSDGSSKKIVIEDSFNNEVFINKDINRIVSLAPSVTEIIYALDAGDKLVGRTVYCKYPEEVLKVDSVGDILNPNIEKIISLKPDLVIASSHFKEDSQTMLSSLGIKTIVLNGEKSVEDILGVIEKIALISGKEDEGKKLISNMRKSFHKKESNKRLKVYYMISFGKFGDYTAGGNTYINDIIEYAGGENIAKDIKGWAYSLETLMQKDPDIIICSGGRGMKDALKKDSLYSKLSAVENNRVYEIDSDYIDIQGPRIAIGIEKIQKILEKEGNNND